MRFLRYIRRWGKKVIFLLNKVDILASGSEVDEVLRAKLPGVGWVILYGLCVDKALFFLLEIVGDGNTIVSGVRVRARRLPSCTGARRLSLVGSSVRDEQRRV